MAKDVSPHDQSSHHHMDKRVPILSEVATVLTGMQIATALLRSNQVSRTALLCYRQAGMFSLKVVHQVGLNQALRPL